MPEEHQSQEEFEFRSAELEAFKSRYGLQNFEDILTWIIAKIREMINSGEIEESKEGVMKAMSIITSLHPEIDLYLRKFVMAADQEMQNEIKQAVRPN